MDEAEAQSDQRSHFPTVSQIVISGELQQFWVCLISYYKLLLIVLCYIPS